MFQLFFVCLFFFFSSLLFIAFLLFFLLIHLREWQQIDSNENYNLSSSFINTCSIGERKNVDWNWLIKWNFNLLKMSEQNYLFCFNRVIFYSNFRKWNKKIWRFLEMEVTMCRDLKKSKINSQNLNYTYCNKRGRYLRTVVEHFEKKKRESRKILNPLIKQ